MATPAVKYRAFGGIVIVCGILLYLMQYKTAVRRMDFTTNYETGRSTFAEHADDNRFLFYVDKYKLRDDILELTGHVNFSGQSKLNTIFIEGLSYLINQAKPFIQSDEKLEISYFRNDYLFSVDRTVKEVSCSSLIKGDKNEIIRAENISTKYPKVAISPKEYMKMTENCSTFITERGYIMDSLTEVENNFPIAFSILMYKDIEQSERLLRAIYRPQNLYCIHVDSKSSVDIFKSMSNIANCFENVFISSKRFKVKWGTMTVLEPELLCMEELWNKSKTWKYFINLTGQEFPLRTNYELVQILTAYNDANDVDGTIKRANKGRWKSAGTPPHGITPVKGSVHIIASRGYVDYVLHDQRAHDFLNWTRRTKVPDETFFASLNHNPALGVPGSYKGDPDTGKKENMKPFVARFKNWGELPCKGKRVRSICVFGTGDLPLLASRRELFVNKFYLDYHRFALDCMEELHFNNTRDEYLGKMAFDARWYSKLGFILNKVE